MTKQETDRAEQTYPLRTVSRLTGLSPELLRAWENRHGIVRPFRTTGGTRRYSAAELERLQLVKAAVDAGNRIGKVAKMDAAELRQQSSAVDTKQSADFDIILKAFENLDDVTAQRSLSLQLATLGPARFAREIALPLMYEFGEMSGALQAKLLRVLEDGSMRRVGSVTERHVNVRVIAATNRDLEKEVREKRFREDLFYRINVLGIQLPPLRDLSGDIKLLAENFVGDEWRIDEEVMRKLESYIWPGNVRQLLNAIDRAKILAEDNRIEIKNMPSAIVEVDSMPVDGAISGGNVDLETLNRIHVMKTYERLGKNKTRTARALGINRRSLYRLLEKYNIS